MKTFKILYDFFDEDKQHWNLGRAIVLSLTEEGAEEMFKFECENYSDIIRIDELTTPQIVWAY